jgi:biopolymer transport protein ExbB
MHHHSAHQGHLHDQLSVSDWVTLSLRQAIDESSAKLQAGMAILASVGSTAPFVGLFGTVWGIYHALVSIGTSGQAGIDKVAGPVGEALIMTALGLAVAIPATFGYNALVRGNKSTMARLNKFGFDLHALFVTGSRSSTGTQPEGKRLTVARSA